MLAGSQSEAVEPTTRQRAGATSRTRGPRQKPTHASVMRSPSVTSGPGILDGPSSLEAPRTQVSLSAARARIVGRELSRSTFHELLRRALDASPGSGFHLHFVRRQRARLNLHVIDGADETETGQFRTAAHEHVPAGGPLSLGYRTEQTTVVAGAVQVHVQRAMARVVHARDVVPATGDDLGFPIARHQATRCIRDLESDRSRALIDREVELITELIRVEARYDCGVVRGERARVDPGAERHAADEPQRSRAFEIDPLRTVQSHRRAGDVPKKARHR